MKRKTTKMLYGLLFVGTMALTPFPAFADDGDSNADAIRRVVRSSTGAMIKVPFDAQGNENTNAAELRVVRAPPSESVTSRDLPEIWASGIAMSRSTAVSADTSTDSSTNWWGWRNWYGYGYQPYYYYNYYRPYYNYYGDYYNYGYYNYYPLYYNYYNSYGSNYGWRYYYYNSYW